MKQRVVILGSDIGDVGYLYSVVSKTSDVCAVIIERPVDRVKVFMRRVKRFGLLAALGQVLFVLLALPIIRFCSRRRVKALRTTHEMDVHIPPPLVHHVPSVNSKEADTLLQTYVPSCVLVYGTRVIAARVLRDIAVPCINIHAGITPEYRGGHGAYWALAEGKPELAGVTLHRIDAGIDTGEVLSQSHITPTAADTIVTYPLLQLVAGAQLAKAELTGQGTHTVLSQGTSSPRLYTHPTLWEYLFYLVTRGIK